MQFRIYQKCAVHILPKPSLVPDAKFHLWHTKFQPLNKPNTTISILRVKCVQCNSPTKPLDLLLCEQKVHIFFTHMVYMSILINNNCGCYIEKTLWLFVSRLESERFCKTLLSPQLLSLSRVQSPSVRWMQYQCSCSSERKKCSIR